MPCDILSLGQTDAGREKAARETPHLLAYVVSSIAKMFFSFLRTVGGCPRTLTILDPPFIGIILYFIIPQHPFNENILLEMPMKNFCEFVKS